MSGMQFDAAGRYIIEQFGRKRPFSSFLPGIAGRDGIPLWLFTVNRGQAVAAFGVETKDNPIMEFEPANKAYERTPLVGFRTFLKLTQPMADVAVDGASPPLFYEPFAPTADDATRMAIGMNDLLLRADNAQAGVRTEVLYFIVPGEPFAALARRLTLTNTGTAPLTLEILDGMPRMLPYGVDNDGLKQIGRTQEAWMAVYDAETNVPFYRLRAGTADSAEVAEIQAGNFYLAFDESNERLPVIVDPEPIFGFETSYQQPVGFLAQTQAELLAAPQFTRGKTPAAFAVAAVTLAAGESYTINTVIGHIGNRGVLDALLPRLTQRETIASWHTAACDLVVDLTDTVATQSADPIFDAYTRQTFLDNVLRGGWPIVLADRFVYHIYSRKHGDLERDYNAFFAAAEPYSQGNGNFRDVAQNRRCDVLLKPAVGAFNIRMFAALIQLDGYNPLVVRGTEFSLPPAAHADLLPLVDAPDLLASWLTGRFTPGGLLRRMIDHGVTLHCTPEQFIDRVLAHADQHVVAEHGEGFWVDHWTYQLDLIENYLAVFPEMEADLLFGAADLPFFQGGAFVRPRAGRYVLTARGARQYYAIEEGEHGAPGEWVTTRRGKRYQTTLFVKLLCLAVTRFAVLDPHQMGIAMEAGKPGWYDALNGLPGLFGSSMNEAYELLRLLRYLLAAIDTHGKRRIRLPMELHQFLHTVDDCLHTLRYSMADDRRFAYWDAVAHAREIYRASVRNGLDGHEMVQSTTSLAVILRHFHDQVADGIARAGTFATGGVPVTYFRYEVTDYVQLAEQDAAGRPFVEPLAFEPHPLPLFLEGPVHALKVAPDRAAAAAIHQAVLASDLYDHKLRMFKVNASLAAEGDEIGRAGAFTPGWLENESIWMHMAYKYLLELLNAGLHDEFFTALRDGLIPFQDPARYGRSPLENSSFVVSSAHPDERLHGNGFVARSSGSTAEYMSIWLTMMAGRQPFRLHSDQLHLVLDPTLPDWLFAADGTLSFTFLGNCRVTYHNPLRRATFGTERVAPRRMTLTTADGETITLDGDTIGAPWAEQVRSGQIAAIAVELGPLE